MTSTKVNVIKRLFDIQQHRALSFSEFNSLFKQLQNQEIDDKTYTEMVEKITSKFYELSANVNAIELECRSLFEQSSLPHSIRTLQNNEKQKLNSSVQYQIIRREINTVDKIIQKLLQHQKEEDHQHQHTTLDTEE
jgi:hypothetical protein